MKEHKGKIILSTALTLLPALFGAVMWESLPQNMATSFGISGEVTGYSSKLFAVLGLYVFLAFINIICVIAMLSDPKRRNVGSKITAAVLSLVPACSLLCGVCIYGNALGYTIKVETVMPVFFGILFFAIGIILPKCKQNYTVGIRLPWTLHDEENWDKTHQLAGKLWAVCGIAMVITGILKLHALFFVLLFLMILIPSVYSYILYRKK